MYLGDLFFNYAQQNKYLSLAIHHRNPFECAQTISGRSNSNNRVVYLSAITRQPPLWASKREHTLRALLLVRMGRHITSRCKYRPLLREPLEPYYTTFGIPTRCTIMELVRLHFERYSRTFLRGTCFHSSYRNIFFVLILGCLFEKGHRYLFLEFLLSVVYPNTNRLTFCIGLGSRPLSGVIFYRYSVRLWIQKRDVFKHTCTLLYLVLSFLSARQHSYRLDNRNKDAFVCPSMENPRFIYTITPPHTLRNNPLCLFNKNHNSVATSRWLGLRTSLHSHHRRNNHPFYTISVMHTKESSFEIFQAMVRHTASPTINLNDCWYNPPFSRLWYHD